MDTGRERWIWVVVVAGCLGLSACFWTADVVVQRASRELGCPAANVFVIERNDIADQLYDVAACGQRARYTCIYGENVPTRCIREPNPPKWDPDPMVIASLPGPSGAAAAVPEARPICGEETVAACLYKDGKGAWRWRPAITPPACRGGGLACQ